MLNLFQHLTCKVYAKQCGSSCGVLKQVQHDFNIKNAIIPHPLKWVITQNYIALMTNNFIFGL